MRNISIPVMFTIIFICFNACKEDLTYWSGDEETGEKIEKCIESCSKDRGYLVVGCDGNGHHSIVRPV